MLFAKNQLNQVRDPDTSDGHPRVMLDGEDAFAELDGVFSRTVRSVLERTAAAARRTTVDMDRETRQRLQQFVVMQFLRNHGKCDLPAFFGPVITGEQRQLKFVVRLRVLPGQREPALPTSALRHPSQP